MTSIVFFEDNLKVMPRYQDNYFDLAYVDPEYGIGESNKNHKSRNTPVKQKNGNIKKIKDPIYVNADWDNEPPSDEYFYHLKRISKNQFIWGANYFKQIVSTPFNSPKRIDFEYFIKHNPIGWVIWDKLNGKNDFNDCELAFTSINKPSIIIPYLWSGMMQGISIQYGNIQKGDKKNNEKRIHPTQKPMPINNWVLKNYLDPTILNPKIFDGGVGSGGSRISSYNYGCEFVGCENNKMNFDLQEKRFNTHVSNLRLFSNERF